MILPYIKNDDSGKDKNGVVIRVGDILEATNNGVWRYFTAERGYDGTRNSKYGDGIEIRCFNAHNVGMVDLSQLTNLGNYKKNEALLREEGMWEECLKDPGMNPTDSGGE